MSARLPVNYVFLPKSTIKVKQTVTMTEKKKKTIVSRLPKCTAFNKQVHSILGMTVRSERCTVSSPHAGSWFTHHPFIYADTCILVQKPPRDQRKIQAVNPWGPESE